MEIALSSREMEVLSLAAAGYSRKEIAEQLSITRDTVHTHVTHILAKRGLHSWVETVVQEIKEEQAIEEFLRSVEVAE